MAAVAPDSKTYLILQSMGLLLLLAAIFAILFFTGLIFLLTWLTFRMLGKSGYRKWALIISILMAIVIFIGIFATFLSSV